MEFCTECGKLDPHAVVHDDEAMHVCDECIDKYCDEQEERLRKKLH